MNQKIVVFAFILLALVVSVAAVEHQPLTFEQRVKAQEAIERVYYNHRIWPKENPTPKPPFEQMVPRAALEAKVTDYLKKSAALGEFWQRPIQPEQLQAEMDRMAKGTKDPATLRELFAALNNDPYLIAECLARPILADRLIRNWYATDERLHVETKTKAEVALASTGGGSLSFCNQGNYQKMAYVLGDAGDNTSRPQDTKNSGAIALDAKRFEKEMRESPEEGRPAILKETSEAFLLIRTMLKTSTRIELETRSFLKQDLGDWLKSLEPWERGETASSATHEFTLPVIAATACGEAWDNGILDDVPDPRSCYSAVWTGLEMIVWGGIESDYTNTGGRYNPSTDTWMPTSTEGTCPLARAYHTAVWTGTEMIIWGGRDDKGYYWCSGGRYNPSSDTWTQTSTGTNCPWPRHSHTAVWTGTEMIVWGGIFSGPLDTGGRYNPSTDTWVATSTGTNCPSGRYEHTAVWTGSVMIVWGGIEYGGASVNTGGRYDPSSDTWTPTSIATNCPSSRTCYTAVWTGTEMIIWGGVYYADEPPWSTYFNTGGRYDPSSDTWTPTSAGANCPSVRAFHTAVWTGTEMIVWGGYDDTNFFNTGGRYNPSADSWAPTSTGANVPSARGYQTAVWTGSEMVVWGGWVNGYVNTGGRYAPSSDTWTPTSIGANCPSGRFDHTAVWTGAEMIVWGGAVTDPPYDTNTGGRYNPSTDAWELTSTGANCPSARTYHTAIWTGTEMIVWGGYTTNFSNYLKSGGRYNPSTDTWTATSTVGNCPWRRDGHTAVWTGTEMIVWGGQDASDVVNTGGRYNPSTDTWTPTSTGANCPSFRDGHTAVWTGTEMIIWGGTGEGAFYLNTGGRYNPSSDAWTPTSTGASCPLARCGHTAVWTGTEMIVWGGQSNEGATHCSSTGGRYNPSTDSWTATTTMGCLSPRYGHTSVWTGTEMIVWGGYGGDHYLLLLNDGERYYPQEDSWRRMYSNWGNSPAARMRHTAVWTGSEMIVWGGSRLNSGGLYIPPIAVAPFFFLPDGMVGVLYNQTLVARNGVSPYTFSIAWGDLPPGLALFAGGGLLGAPTVAGSYAFNITVTDANGCTNDVGGDPYNITIAPAAPPGETAPGDTPDVALIWSGKTALLWQFNQQATAYNLYRGVPADLPKLLTSDVDSCVKYNGSSTSASANDDPTRVAGGFYWYLVTGTNANGEGPAGSATSGARVVNSSGTCP